MEQCEGATGLSKSVQMQAKGQGCSAFSESRVYLIPLLRFIFRDKNGRIDWKERYRKFTALTAEAEYKELTGELIRKAEAWEALQILMVIHFESYDRAVQELPALLAGKDAGKIRAQLAKYLDEIRMAEKEALAEAEAKSHKRQPEQKEFVSA